MRIGLRGRFVAVLVGVAALTLAVAAVTLLSPLDARLRADAVRTLSSELRDGRGALTPLRAVDLRAPSRQASPEPTRGRRSGPPTGLPRDVPLRRAIRSLRRRTLAEIELFDGRGRSLLPGEGGEQDVDRDLIRTALRVPGVHTRTHESRHPPEAVAALAVQLRDGSTVVAQATQSLRSVDNAVDVVARAVVLAGIAGLVGALLVGTLLAGRIVRRLRRLRATALRVARDGPAAEMPSETGTDEVADLSRAFATMQRRLREQEEARKAFVATASHELRTPLSSIRGYAELHRVGALREQADVERAMGRIEDEAARMGTLVEELLVLARLDETREKATADVDVSQLAEDAAHDAHAAAPDREITADVDGEAIVHGDGDQLRQVLANLVRNALVHTPAGTPVEISSRRRGRWVEIEVRDHGPGLPDVDPEELFGRFWRKEAGRTRGPSGAGLGLAIVAAIVDAHDGEVEARDADGGGASFVVRLPLAKGAPPASPA